MTEHVFDGHAETTYHEKDAHGQPLGTVIPGEIRHLAQALDHWWREATDADRERWEAIKAEREQAAVDSGEVRQHPGFGDIPMHGTEHPADGSMAPPISNPPPASAPTPAQPAAPAVLPQPATASTDAQEG